MLFIVLFCFLLMEFFFQMFITEFVFSLSHSFSQKYPPVKFLSEKDRKRILVCDKHTNSNRNYIQNNCYTEFIILRCGNTLSGAVCSQNRLKLQPHLQLFSHNIKGNSGFTQPGSYFSAALAMQLYGWQCLPLKYLFNGLELKFAQTFMIMMNPTDSPDFSLSIIMRLTFCWLWIAIKFGMDRLPFWVNCNTLSG